MDNIPVSSKPFVLGKCECGCNDNIPIRTVRGNLQKFTFGHARRIIRKLRLIPCQCKCGELILDKDIRGDRVRFKNRHGTKNTYELGGKFLDKDGYIRFHILHPFTGKVCNIPEHRLVYEKYYKCCLMQWADVRHINHTKYDNRIENLRPMIRRRRFFSSLYDVEMSNEELRTGNNGKITRIEIPLNKLELINKIQNSNVAMTVKEGKLKDLTGGLCCICREMPTKQVTYDVEDAKKIERYCDECIERVYAQEAVLYSKNQIPISSPEILKIPKLWRIESTKP